MATADSPKPAPKGRPYRRPLSQILIIAGVVAIHGALLFLLMRTFRFRSSTAVASVRLGSASTDVHVARQQLEQQVAAWNTRAKAAGLQPLTLQPSSAIKAGGSGASCDANWPPADMVREVEQENPELVSLVHNVMNEKREVMLTLANAIMICKNTTICWWNGGNILESFLTILKHNNITNYVIGVMDDETERYLKAAGIVNYFRVNIKVPSAQEKSHPANKVSTIKYTLVQQLIKMGVHTLVSDMDLVYIKNPFDHLYRDADIESQTDGFNDWAYGVFDGISDKTMGWGGGGLFVKTFTVNVGCIYIRSSSRSLDLVRRVASQLASHPGWDQQVFNEHLLRLSHGDYASSYASLRIMDYLQFMNSKIFFRSRRDEYIPGAKSSAPTPVMVHFNYHPDKHKRMVCIMDRYFYGKLDACDKFPGGSEPNT